MDNSEDLIAHIELLQSRWIEGIKQDFVLQEKIEGHEFAIGSFWNGSKFMTDKDGDEVCEENFEHKSLFPGNLGQSTGEQFTVIRYIKAKNSKLFRETLDKIRPALRKLNFRGDFDINSIVTKKGVYFLEFTPRQGVPATSGHIAIQKGSWGEFLLKIAKGEDTNMEFDPRWCIVSWLYTSPFPFVNPKNIEESKKDITNPEKIYEALTPRLADSMGIKVLFKEKLSKEELNNLHFDSVMFDKGELKIASHDGYVLTVTGLGDTVDEAGDKVEKLLRKIIIPKGFWRNDFHNTNYHKAKDDLEKWGYLSKNIIKESKKMVDNKDENKSIEKLVEDFSNHKISITELNDTISNNIQKTIESLVRDIENKKNSEYEAKLLNAKKEMADELAKIKEAVRGIIYE